ncbi:MAG: VWA domain-containing protein [Candidatus Thorarchaeota archaeon]
MKVSKQYLLLSGVSILLILSVSISSSMIFENLTNFEGQPFEVMTFGSLEPGNVAIEGTIIDSYVDILYTIHFDNSEGLTAAQIDWTFELQEGIRLSNVSIELGSVVYWGRVIPEQEAIEEYYEEVEYSESALLILSTTLGYRVYFNLAGGSSATVCVRIEGLITRDLGFYSLVLPLAKDASIHSDVDVDISIRSNFESIAGYSIQGLPSFTATDLMDGVRIQYSSSDAVDFEGLVIKYAINTQIGGSELLTYTNGIDDFFVYLLAPSITEISDTAPRQYVFILDKSGSMIGTKIEQAKVAFNSMIEQLQPDDLFNVVAFDTDVFPLWEEPHLASTSNISTAQSWVSSRPARGGTNFHGAVMTSLEMMTPGENAKAILMLSDGIPTIGEITDTVGILAAVEEANDLGVSISTVAFGSDSDENLMANLAAQNHGFFVFIQPDEEAAAKLIEFYSEFETPLASWYEIKFDGFLDMSSLVPLNNSPFFNGSEILVCGRYVSPLVVHTTIDYPNGTETYVNTATTASTENEHVEKIWAQHRISYLLRVIELEGETPNYRSEIVDVAMKYGIIVEGYTALLITTDFEPSTTTITDQSDPNPNTTTTSTSTQIATTATCTTTGGYGNPTFDATLSIGGPIAITFVVVGLVSTVLWRRRM